MGEVRSDFQERYEIVPLSLLNVLETFRVARDIFPKSKLEIAISYGISLLPQSIKTPVVTRITSETLGALDYFVARDRQSKRVAGIAGLYSFKERPQEAWLGWFGLSQNARGQGYGGALLDATISNAKERGYETLRLWTDTGPEWSKAHRVYTSRGMSRQELDIYLPPESGNQGLVFSLSLNGKPVEPFAGRMGMACMGESPEAIRQGQENFRKNPPQQALNPT